MRDMEYFLRQAMGAADLMQGYMDIAFDKLENITQEERLELRRLLIGYEPKHTDEKCAKIVLLDTIDTLTELEQKGVI